MASEVSVQHKLLSWLFCRQELRGELILEDEHNLKRKILQGNWSLAKDKASIHANMEKVQTYEEAFAKIQAATGISDIDELASLRQLRSGAQSPKPPALSAGCLPPCALRA